MEIKNIICHKKKGTTIITTLFEFVVIMALMVMFITLTPPILTKLNVDYFTKTLVRTIETNGDYSDTTINNVKSGLASELGLDPTLLNINVDIASSALHYGYSCTSSPAHTAAQKKIQLRNKFTVTVTYPVELKTYMPSIGIDHTKTITVGKTLTGISQTYWK